MATRLNELDEQMRQINERMKTADPQQTQPILKQ